MSEILEPRDGSFLGSEYDVLNHVGTNNSLNSDYHRRKTLFNWKFRQAFEVILRPWARPYEKSTAMDKEKDREIWCGSGSRWHSNIKTQTINIRLGQLFVGKTVLNMGELYLACIRKWYGHWPSSDVRGTLSLTLEEDFTYPSFVASRIPPLLCPISTASDSLSFRLAYLIPRNWETTPLSFPRISPRFCVCKTVVMMGSGFLAGWVLVSNSRRLCMIN